MCSRSVSPRAMARTRQRRRKHKGTQAGTIKQRTGGSRRARRSDARSVSHQRRQHRLDTPPTWRSAVMRGLLASAGLFVLLALALGAPISSSLPLALAAAAVYIPAFHAVDGFAYRRRQRAKERERAGQQG